MKSYFFTKGFKSDSFQLRDLLTHAKEIISSSNLYDCSNPAILLLDDHFAGALGTDILHVSEITEYIIPHLIKISSPRRHEHAFAEEKIEVDNLALITPSPALANLLVLSDPTYANGMVRYPYITKQLSAYIIKHYESIKTPKIRILRLNTHEPLWKLFRVNFIHRCQFTSFLHQHLHGENLLKRRLAIQNSPNISITIQEKEKKDKVIECKNLLISQLKEELLTNQKHIEAALNELRMKDSLIQKLVSSSKPPCNQTIDSPHT